MIDSECLLVVAHAVELRVVFKESDTEGAKVISVHSSNLYHALTDAPWVSLNRQIRRNRHFVKVVVKFEPERLQSVDETLSAQVLIVKSYELVKYTCGAQLR